MESKIDCPRCGGSAREEVNDMQYCLECGLVISDLSFVQESWESMGTSTTYLPAGLILPLTRGKRKYGSCAIHDCRHACEMQSELDCSDCTFVMSASWCAFIIPNVQDKDMLSQESTARKRSGHRIST